MIKRWASAYLHAKFEHQGSNFRNFPNTFSKDLPMPDDLGIPKKFSYPNFRRLPLHFQRTSYLPKLVQPIRCAYTDHVM